MKPEDKQRHRKPPNKRLERTVIRHRGDAASAPFHYALASRFTRQRAAAQPQRYAQMASIVPISICLLALASMLSAEAQQRVPLERLAQQLQQLRALQQGAPSQASCPDDTSPFVGLNQSALRAALGAPDFMQPGVWAYFLTSPLGPGQRGGGFPELTFIFDPANVVSEVACHYAR